MPIITKEDVIDAIDEESENRLDLLTDFWQLQLEEDGGKDPKQIVATTLACAKMLYSAKAYQDALDWLDAVGLELGKTYGEESEQYVAFLENEDIENLRMEALDRSSIEEEEEEDDMGDDE